MEKKIENYLHLYLGCECEIKGQPNAILGAVGIKSGEQVIVRWPKDDEWSYADVTEVKPILRPLSSMTEEEMKEFASIQREGITKIKFEKGKIWSFVDHEGFYKWHPHSLDTPTPEQFCYLLSKHFDLFGLIDAGLALSTTDKSK